MYILYLWESVGSPSCLHGLHTTKSCEIAAQWLSENFLKHLLVHLQWKQRDANNDKGLVDRTPVWIQVMACINHQQEPTYTWILEHPSPHNGRWKDSWPAHHYRAKHWQRMYAGGFNQSHGESDVNLNGDHHPRMKNLQDETTNQKMALSYSMQGDAPDSTRCSFAPLIFRSCISLVLYLWC